MSVTHHYTKPILFFDGKCGLCNRLVNFVMSHDPKHQLNFATLQGQTANVLLDIKKTTDLNTLVFYDEGKIFTKSAAVLQIISYLNWPWKIILIAKLFPTKLCDIIYNFISKRRYSWFGSSDSCRLPTSEEKLFFLP